MSTHWHTRSALLALLLLARASTTLLAAEDTTDSAVQPTYRSDVSEVRVTFFATDENNHPVETLTKSDFAVVDNEEVLRNFRSFTHSQETSLDLVVLVDLSESVAPRVRAAMSDVLHLVAQEQSIPDDNLAVLAFSGMRPVILCSSACGAASSVARLMDVRSGGTTPLFDALIFGVDFISQHLRAIGTGDVRPVVILFSDGYDTISLHSAREALQAAQDAGAPIYSVDMGNMGTPTSGGRFLQKVSEATGGRYFAPSPRSSHQDAAAAALAAMLQDLRASYVVTYDVPSQQAGFHSLRLLPTHNLNLTFHNRSAYDYEPRGQSLALNTKREDR
jgi:VWFA-related protein